METGEVHFNLWGWWCVRGVCGVSIRVCCMCVVCVYGVCVYVVWCLCVVCVSVYMFLCVYMCVSVRRNGTR